MDLNNAIAMIWDNRKYVTNDPKTAISHLNEEVAESLKALLRGDIDEAKKELQDAMSCLFIAMKVLGVDPEEAVQNQVREMTKKNNKVMVVKSDKVEIYVDGSVKASWSIWSDEDIKEVEKLAKEFGCELIFHEE